MFRVWQRDWDVYLTTWFVSFLPPLLEPVLYLLAFGLGLGTMVEDIQYQGHTLRYLTFFAPGVVAIAIMFHSYYECLVRQLSSGCIIRKHSMPSYRHR